MNAFELLESDYKKQFKTVFKKLSYQMLYSEACILLNTLKGVSYVPSDDYSYRWQLKFKDWLSIK